MKSDTSLKTNDPALASEAFRAWMAAGNSGPDATKENGIGLK